MARGDLLTLPTSWVIRTGLLVSALSGSVSAQKLVHDLPPHAAAPEPLNVVVLLTDDMGHDLVGTYANRYPCVGFPPGSVPVPCTPSIDQLAAEGVLFTNAWSSPLCSPTRAQILTGRQARHNGVGEVTWPANLQISGLDPDITTIADLFGVSAAIGKWHMAAPNQISSHWLACGFDSFAGTMWNLSPPPGDGPDYYDWRRYQNLASPVAQTEYATTVTFDDAIERIEKLNAGPGPWLLYVATHAAHLPFHCPTNPQGSFPCPEDWWATCPAGCAYPSETCTIRAAVQALDYEIGRFLEHVDARDTAVILVGDNGTTGQGKNRPFLNGSKSTLYQGGVNVPLIVRGPGFQPGKEVHELVHVSDLMATMADLALLPPPNLPLLDSVSFASQLSPAYPQVEPRKYVYAESFRRNFVPIAGQPPAGYQALQHDRALRNDKYKLIELNDTLSTSSYEFYLMYDASPGAPPTPQDPSVTPDPHELFDLMPNQANWSAEEQAAFLELATELTTNYPSLVPSS